MTDGWIKLYRTLKEKPIWKCSSPEQKTILITLLMMVNHEETEWEWLGQKFKVKPGQKITSLDNIAKESGKGISVQNVRTALKKLESYGFLTNESTKTGRLITIANWELYQSKEKSQQSDKQRSNKELTPNKNDKNDKKLYIDYFDTFWNAYPKKVGKAVAQKTFSKLKINDELISIMILAIENQQQSKQWSDKQFIPNPATWLNQKRWEDEFDSVTTEEHITMTADGTFKI